MQNTYRFLCCVLAGLQGCAPASLVEVDPPNSLVDPATVATPAGATQLYNFALNNFSMRLGGDNASIPYILATGLATDELMFAGNVTSLSWHLLDRRVWNTVADITPYRTTTGLYNLWHQPRIEARQAREALQLYAPLSPKALQGQLYAIEGYSVIWFAEFFCSGIPFSTVSLSGFAQPAPGLTTEQMFTYAIALFDSAESMSSDSARLLNLARVGKGRALLGVGRFAEAAAAVANVPTQFVYNTEHGATPNQNGIGQNPRLVFVRDNEGGAGLTWSTDPRAAIVTTTALSSTMPYSAKYSRTAAGTLDATQTILDNPVRAADGLEARLIEAEADLAAGGTNWLAILNALRSTCVGSAACAPVPGLTASSLPPLTDPGSSDARLDMLMMERAAWLFLTGHRYGDLRRLASVYDRSVNSLWPTGVYVNPGFSPSIPASPFNGTNYGDAVVGSPEGSATSEKVTNPLYAGCVTYDP